MIYDALINIKKLSFYLQVGDAPFLNSFLELPIKKLKDLYLMKDDDEFEIENTNKYIGSSIREFERDIKVRFHDYYISNLTCICTNNIRIYFYYGEVTFFFNTQKELRKYSTEVLDTVMHKDKIIAQLFSNDNIYCSFNDDSEYVTVKEF